MAISRPAARPARADARGRPSRPRLRAILGKLNVRGARPRTMQPIAMAAAMPISSFSMRFTRCGPGGSPMLVRPSSVRSRLTLSTRAPGVRRGRSTLLPATSASA